jgi:hypothetical protein
VHRIGEGARRVVGNGVQHDVAAVVDQVVMRGALGEADAHDGPRRERSSGMHCRERRRLRRLRGRRIGIGIGQEREDGGGQRHVQHAPV